MSETNQRERPELPELAQYVSQPVLLYQLLHLFCQCYRVASKVIRR